MPVSEPLRLGDKLRQAMIEAQQVLESTDLRGKIKLDIQTSGAPVAEAEAAMDRTEAAAKSAVEAGGGGGGGVGVLAEGPLSPMNKMADAMEKLIKALEGVPDALDRPARRRKAAAGEPPADDSSPYMNPYLLTGLVQNPLGTMRGMGTSALLGGSGMGVKPPGWLQEMLAGSSGEFSIGKALGASTLGGEAGAAAFMAPALIGAAGVGTFATAAMGTFHFENKIAQDRARDAEARVNDFRFGNAAGFNWRGATWGGGGFQSRSDIDVGDIRELVQGAGVGFQGLYNRGRWQMMGGSDSGAQGGLQSAVNTALNIGLGPGQVGGILGAATRAGTIDMNAEGGIQQMLRFLGLIETWTAKSAAYGLSTSEAMSAMAMDSRAQAASAHGMVTAQAERTMLSMRSNIMAGMPAGMERVGTDMALNALGTPSGSDTQTVLEMNTYLKGDRLTTEGEAWANEALGEDVVKQMRAQYGAAADTFIAHAAVQTRLGGMRGKAAAARQMQAGGASAMQAAMVLFGGDTAGAAVAMGALQRGDIFRDTAGNREGGVQGRGIGDLRTIEAGGGAAAPDGMQTEIALRRTADVMTAASGATANFATDIAEADNALKNFNRTLIHGLGGQMSLDHDGPVLPP